MTATAPDCADCAHLQGTSQCGRPVPRYYNPATRQYRSRIAVSAAFERSDRKFFGRQREKCGPEGVFFAPRDWPDAPLPQHDTLADSDGDDGA
jgi:hypothetical protein